MLLDRRSVPQWNYSLAMEIKRSLVLELVPVFLHGVHANDRHQRRSSSNGGSLLFRLWNKLDRRLCNPDIDVLQLREFDNSLNPAESLEISVSNNGARPYLPESELGKLKRAALDVILLFCDQVSVEPISQCARYGAWILGNSDSVARNGQIFWAMCENSPLCEASLKVVRNDLSQQHVIHHSFYATHPSSLFHNQNAAYSKAADYLKRHLVNLHEFGWDYVIQSRNGFDRQVWPEAKSKLPSNQTMALFLPRWFLKAATQRARKRFFREQWFIAWRKKPLGTSSWKDMQDFQLLLPPQDRFYADPFLFEKDNRTYIFVEDYKLNTKRGGISCIEIKPDGTLGEPDTVLELDTHISCPNTFESDGQIYLLPDTLEKRQIQLYRAVNFPRQWTLEKVLIEGISAVDPTLFEHNGKFWLFAANPQNDELFLFYSDSLFGKWNEHPRNPIVSDVRRARPAGHVFFEDGRIIRPAQDCSRRYGYSVSLNEVQVLSETEYAEAPIGMIHPTWVEKNQGTHTFNQNRSYQVVDGRFLIRR